MQSVLKQLSKFDLDTLDFFEGKMYRILSLQMEKTEALQTIINSVLGKFSDLSDSLREIAEQQHEEREMMKNKKNYSLN